MKRFIGSVFGSFRHWARRRGGGFLFNAPAEVAATGRVPFAPPSTEQLLADEAWQAVLIDELHFLRLVRRTLSRMVEDVEGEYRNAENMEIVADRVIRRAERLSAASEAEQAALLTKIGESLRWLLTGNKKYLFDEYLKESVAAIEAREKHLKTRERQQIAEGDARLQEIDLSEHITSAVRFHKLAAGPCGIAFRTNVAMANKVIIDVGRLDSLLDHLLMNSVVAVTNRIEREVVAGEIVVHAHKAHRDGEEVLLIAVADNGVGLTNDERAQAIRTDAACEHGLQIVARIAKWYGGFVELRSAYGSTQVTVGLNLLLIPQRP